LFAATKKESDPKTHYDWRKENLLGSGNFAEVFECKLLKGVVRKDFFDNPVPSPCAVKVINLSKVEDMNDIDREIGIMKIVNHKNIIKLFEIFRNDKKYHYLVMELVTGGELFDRIVDMGNYTEKYAADCTHQVCQGLHYLHNHPQGKIVHRDLKPENLLYQAKPGEPHCDVIKIADFGLARTVSGSGDMMKTACGTPGYVAPEILMNKGYDNTAVDMWSVGVIAYILLCGFPPFYEEELPRLFDTILKAKYDFPSPWWDSVSKDAVDLIKNLIKIDVDKRYTAMQTMEDKWMKNASSEILKGADDIKDRMKKMKGKQLLKKAALGVMAKQRLERALKELRGDLGSQAKGCA